MDGQKKGASIGWLLMGLVLLIALVMLVIYLRNKAFLSVGTTPPPVAPPTAQTTQSIAEQLKTTPVQNQASTNVATGATATAKPLGAAPQAAPVVKAPVVVNTATIKSAVQVPVKPLAAPIHH